MSEVIGLTFLENMKVLVAAVFIYVIIFALLKKTEVLGNDTKINSLVALLAAIIVSFTGVVTYVVSYAMNWFVILFMILFLAVLMMMFMGIGLDDLISNKGKTGKIIIGVMFFLFALLFFKGFFALNNALDLNNPPEDMYEVDASANTGVDDITNEELDVDTGWFEDLFGDWEIEQDLLYAVLFLAVLGVFVWILSK